MDRRHLATRSLLAVVATVLAAPTDARAGDAFDDLCRAAGGNCDVNVPVPPPSPPSPVNSASGGSASQTAPAPRPPQLTERQQLEMMVVGAIFQGLLDGLFSSPSESKAAAARAAAEAAAARQQALEALRRRADHVRAQREAREREREATLEEMRDVMAEPFDMGGPGPSAPAPVRLDEGSGKVALFAPPTNPFARPAPRSDGGAARLAALAAENEDVARLVERLEGLEGELAAVRARAVELRRSTKALAREYSEQEEEVARTVEEAQERGVSMVLQGVIQLKKGALDRLDQVRTNDEAWRTATALLRRADSAVGKAEDRLELAENLAKDTRWLLQDRDVKKDLLYLGERLGGPYYEHGSSIVQSSLAVRRQLEIVSRQREMSGLDARYRAELEEVTEGMKRLQEPLRQAREAVARATGIPAASLPRPTPPDRAPPTGIGSFVPDPRDND